MLYVLLLNNMRDMHFETLLPIAWSENSDKLTAFVEGELVNPYTDLELYLGELRHWGKVFRKGGPLEYYNPPTWISRRLSATGVGGIRELRASVIDGQPVMKPFVIEELLNVPRL